MTNIILPVISVAVVIAGLLYIFGVPEQLLADVSVEKFGNGLVIRGVVHNAAGDPVNGATVHVDQEVTTAQKTKNRVLGTVVSNKDGIFSYVVAPNIAAPAINSGVVNLSLTNSSTGPGSINRNIVSINQSDSRSVTNNATANNIVTANVNTGGNTVSGNTTSGSITTGSVNFKVSVNNGLNILPVPVVPY